MMWRKNAWDVRKRDLTRLSWMAGLLVLASLLLLAACNRQQPATPAITPTAAREQLPARNASAVVQPGEGTTLVLSDGAQVVIPPGALSDKAVASLEVREAPSAPVPRSILGRSYSFALDGGQLTGIAQVTIPLPAGASADQYDLGVYRWTGRAWERLSSRLTGRGFQFGTNSPGLFAVQGQWRFADASLILVIPAGEPGRQTVPMAAVGQYRYWALPDMAHDFLPARLTLKRDTSGGAGQISGDESLDQTVAETVLWFKPDPAQAQGVIEFSHVFEVAPGSLDVLPGETTRFYALLKVEDALAPTLRLSTGVAYVQELPIQVVGDRVVRPQLAREGAVPLRWRVLLNGLPFLERAATELTLTLAEILAEGGLGEYRIALEARTGSTWQQVSNEVTVQLRLPATATPTPSVTPGPGAIAAITATPGGAPTPVGTIPPTPTRRTPPGGLTPTPTPAASPTETPPENLPTVTPTRPAWANIFRADKYILGPGECAVLSWNVENVTAVFLRQGTAAEEGVAGVSSRRVCPAQTTTYTLRIVSPTGTEQRTVTLTVQETAQAAVSFTASPYEIQFGQCATLQWSATDVNRVFLDDVGVPGVDSRQVCPDETTTYTLRVEALNGSVITKTVTVTVYSVDDIVIRFWAEQYTLLPGQCTVLHWTVERVRAVYLVTTGPEEGVPGVGTRQVCPDGVQFYTLRAETADGADSTKIVTISAEEPALSPGEIIAQGVVNAVTRSQDVLEDVPGEQPGWKLLIDGINPLFSGTGGQGCCAAVVSLAVDEVWTDQFGEGPVDWPINPGQLVEFRAVCSDNVCVLEDSLEFYLRLRSD